MWALALWDSGIVPLQWGVVIGASLAAAFSDLRTRRIPNALTLPLCARRGPHHHQHMKRLITGLQASKAVKLQKIVAGKADCRPVAKRRTSKRWLSLRIILTDVITPRAFISPAGNCSTGSGVIARVTVAVHVVRTEPKNKPCSRNRRAVRQQGCGKTCRNQKQQWYVRAAKHESTSCGQFVYPAQILQRPTGAG